MSLVHLKKEEKKRRKSWNEGVREKSKRNWNWIVTLRDLFLRCQKTANWEFGNWKFVRLIAIFHFIDKKMTGSTHQLRIQCEECTEPFPVLHISNRMFVDEIGNELFEGDRGGQSKWVPCEFPSVKLLAKILCYLKW